MVAATDKKRGFSQLDQWNNSLLLNILTLGPVFPLFCPSHDFGIHIPPAPTDPPHHPHATKHQTPCHTDTERTTPRLLDASQVRAISVVARGRGDGMFNQTLPWQSGLQSPPPEI
jgi:hypothetical protein